MKALVLCGGLPQVELIKELKRRNIYTILVDINPEVIARQYADEFVQLSVLDDYSIRELAKKERVSVVLTACADQVLVVQAKVSEELGLPCYIDYRTAKDVSDKELMKRIFVENEIPTAKHVVMKAFNEEALKELQYPMIVKPVDSYSSRGVRKVDDLIGLKRAFDNALKIGRKKTIIIEEYLEGEELTVDVYVEEGKAHVLCISNIDKIPNNDRFVICRTRYPAQISDELKSKVEIVADKVASAFNLKNTPMLIQMISDGKNVSVVEFCARTGGGDKFRLIKQVSGFDVIKAIVDLTFGEKPHVETYQLDECIVNEFVYTQPGVFDHIEGFNELKQQGIIEDYFQLKTKGTECGGIMSSGDRVAFYSIQGKSIAEAKAKDQKANDTISVVDNSGKDIMRHDIVATY